MLSVPWRPWSEGHHLGMGEQEVVGGVLLCVRCEGDRCLVLLSWWHGEPHQYSSTPVVGVFVSGGFSC